MNHFVKLFRNKTARWSGRGAGDEKGQATAEYALITAMLLGGTVLSWPFFIELINALQAYYNSVYWVIQAPFP